MDEIAKPGKYVETLQAENAKLKLQLSEVTAHRGRLRDMLNEIRGRAHREVFSSEPSNFAALILKIVEDGYTEKWVEQSLKQCPAVSPSFRSCQREPGHEGAHEGENCKWQQDE